MPSPLAPRRPNLVAIADWCAVTYVTPGESRSETLKRIKEYLNDALQTVTQQIMTCATTLQSTVDQMAGELQACDATMRLIENRLASQKEHLARSAMLTQFMRRLPAPRLDLEEPIEPKATEAVFRTTHGTIDFDALDTIGRAPPRMTTTSGKSKPAPPPPPPPPGGFTTTPDGRPLGPDGKPAPPPPPPPPPGGFTSPPPPKPKPPPLPPQQPPEPDAAGWAGGREAFATNRL